MPDCAQTNERRLSPAQASSLTVDEARAEERRLCAIVDSDTATAEEKYQALLDLTSLTGVLIHDVASAA
jgi:hypothetical protein